MLICNLVSNNSTEMVMHIAKRHVMSEAREFCGDLLQLSLSLGFELQTELLFSSYLLVLLFQK